MDKPKAAMLAGAAVVTAQLIGGRNGPMPDQPLTTAWYAALNKPGFTPPDVVFPVAWTALSALLGYSGYRLLTAPRTPTRRPALWAWSLNLLGICTYSWLMFGRKRLGAGLAVTIGMVGSSSALVATAARVRRDAALAGVPLVAWTAFATLLQEEVWRRNRGSSLANGKLREAALGRR